MYLHDPLFYLVAILSVVSVVGLSFVMINIRTVRLGFNKLKYEREYRYYKLHQPIMFLIREVEDEMNIRLTQGTRDMISIPIIELIDYDINIDWDEVKKSIHDLIKSMMDYKPQYKKQEKFDSLALIYSFHSKFCNIPPFCNRTENKQNQ
jgi:hypothetical protein